MLKRLVYTSFVFIILAFTAAVFWGARGFTVFGPAKIADSGDVAVLVLGKVGNGGQGGRWNEATNLADAIVLLRYRPSINTAELISIPRDLYGDFGGETFKVNEVIVRDKIPALLDKLPEITGVSTDKFLVIDLRLVKRIVDTIGGIDLDLPEGVTDQVSGYTLETGRHHLNGDDVVWLIRNRFAPQGDFFREKNQHLTIETLAKKFVDLNFAERTRLFFTLAPEMNSLQTNINLGMLFPKASGLGDIHFKEVVLNFSTGLLDGHNIPFGAGEEYVLTPKAGINNYSDIREYITLALQPSP